MRFKRILAAGVLALFCASCTDRTVTVVTPMRSAKPVLDKGFHGVLGLMAGDRIEVQNAFLVQGWVCGDRGREAPGAVCVAADKISTLEATEHRSGALTMAFTGVLAVVFSPLLAMFALDEHEKSRSSKQAEKRAAEDRYRDEVMSAASGLPPERVRRAGAELARCLGFKGEAAREANAAVLAREVVQSRRSCLEPAINYYRVLEEPEKAVPLVLTRLARSRYEALACGQSDPGLRAPRAYEVSGATDWMADYRAVASNLSTYDYKIFERECWSSQPGADPESFVADRYARREARRVVTTTFPLTDFQAPAG